MMHHFKDEIDEDFYSLDIHQSPQLFLDVKSHQWKINLNSEQFAKTMDIHDPLKYIRQEFHYPTMYELPYGLYSLIFY